MAALANYAKSRDRHIFLLQGDLEKNGELKGLDFKVPKNNFDHGLVCICGQPNPKKWRIFHKKTQSGKRIIDQAHSRGVW